MIKLNHVTKIYKTKNKELTYALRDVSFSLPDVGFVFVLGRSGSGKSTLLNLIGNLDTFNEGEILIDGKSSKDFSKEETDYFRSSYCGFIFQDYQLINELTVEENIALSLEIKGDTPSAEEMSSLLDKLEIEKLKNKYPSELSGGEKQRVGIARALIKNPKVILCDEPTGNLDQETSKAILDLLKEASKNCLVFIVSHDYQSSIIYADRRITIDKGKIIKDEVRVDGYFNEFKIVDEVAYLPYLKNMDEVELDDLKQRIKDDEVKRIVQVGEGFIPYPPSKEGGGATFKKEETHLHKKCREKLSRKYLFSSLKYSCFSTIIHSLLLILMILIQTFLSFTPGKLYLDNISLENKNNVLISNIQVADELKTENYDYYDDIYFRGENAFEGIKSYDVTNYTVTSYTFSAASSYVEAGRRASTPTNFLNLQGFYLNSSLGTAIVDKDYLKNAFGVDGELTLLAGSLEGLDDPTSDKIIITDYMADALLDTYYYVKFLTYADLIGKFKPVTRNNSTYSAFSYVSANIGAIISTGYREKYKDLVDAYERLRQNDFPFEEYDELLSSDTFLDFFSEAYNGELSLSYSLNPDFYHLLKNAEFTSREMAYLAQLYLSLDETPSKDDRQFSYADYYKCNAHEKISSEYDGEYAMAMLTSYYKTLCVKAKKASLIGETVYIIKTRGNQLGGEIQEVLPVKIIGTNDNMTILNGKTLKKICSMQTCVSSKLIPTSEKNVESKVNELISEGYSMWDINNSVYSLINQTINVFSDLFIALEVAVGAVLFIWLMVSSILNIMRKRYQIGIYKALGMKNGDLTGIFLSKNLFFGLLSLILTTLLCPLIFSLANLLVSRGYNSAMNISLDVINIFYFHFDVFTYIYLGVIVLFILFTLLPLLLIKGISPVKIVNNKSDD